MGATDHHNCLVPGWDCTLSGKLKFLKIYFKYFILYHFDIAYVWWKSRVYNYTITKQWNHFNEIFIRNWTGLVFIAKVCWEERDGEREGEREHPFYIKLFDWCPGPESCDRTCHSKFNHASRKVTLIAAHQQRAGKTFGSTEIQICFKMWACHFITHNCIILHSFTLFLSSTYHNLWKSRKQDWLSVSVLAAVKWMVDVIPHV